MWLAQTDSFCDSKNQVVSFWSQESDWIPWIYIPHRCYIFLHLIQMPQLCYVYGPTSIARISNLMYTPHVRSALLLLGGKCGRPHNVVDCSTFWVDFGMNAAKEQVNWICLVVCLKVEDNLRPVVWYGRGWRKGSDSNTYIYI